MVPYGMILNIETLDGFMEYGHRSPCRVLISPHGLELEVGGVLVSKDGKGGIDGMLYTRGMDDIECMDGTDLSLC